jgi:iron complex outermembrane receptor protein
MVESNRYRLLALACCGAAMCLTQQAYAQTATTGPTPSATPGAEASPEEVIVTAQKRSERLQDVPISVTVASGDQLKSLGITDPVELEKLVPGFTVNKTVFGLPVFFIRGVGFNDFTLGVSPGVTVYTDQLPVPYGAMTRGAILDLERVEVLKGPQGTLFGQNSTGGAVNFIAAKPTDHLEAGADLSYGRFNEVDAEAFISGPISDTISARLAVRNESRGDWQQGYTTNESLGRKDFHNARLLVDWKPTDRVKVELSGTGWQDKSDAQQEQLVKFTPLNPGPGAAPLPYPIQTFPAAPNDARAAAWDTNRSFREDDYFYQFGGRIDVKLTDNIDLTSLTSYAQYGQDTPTDFDATTYPLSVSHDLGNIRSFSQEVRLSGSAAADRVKWMTGVNYQHDRVDEHLVQNPLTTSAGAIGPFVFDAFSSNNLQDIKTKSAFGSLDYKIVDTLTAQGSVRYTQQNRDFTGCLQDIDGTFAPAIGFLSTILTGTPQTIAPGACAMLNPQGFPVPILLGKLDQDNVSWRASLNWKPDTDTLIYANITKGYKSGSFPTIPAVITNQAAPIPQESVLTYEIGTKLTGFSRKLVLDGAVFYYDYRDKQLSGYHEVAPFGALPGLVSIPKTDIKGAEISATLRPFDGLTLSANGTYVDTRVDSNPFPPIGPFGNTANFIGQSFPNTPKWQGVFDAEYRFPAAGSLSPYLGTSVSLHSSTSGSLLSGDPAVASEEALLKIPGYTLLDVRAGVETQNGSWRLEAWGRNVTNRFYLIGNTRQADYLTRYTGMPATYGISLYYRFNNGG